MIQKPHYFQPHNYGRCDFVVDYHGRVPIFCGRLKDDPIHNVAPVAGQNYELEAVNKSSVGKDAYVAPSSYRDRAIKDTRQAGAANVKGIVKGYYSYAVEQRALVLELTDALKTVQFGFNHRRCSACGGFDNKTKSETDMKHAKTCPVGVVLAKVGE